MIDYGRGLLIPHLPCLVLVLLTYLSGILNIDNSAEANNPANNEGFGEVSQLNSSRKTRNYSDKTCLRSRDLFLARCPQDTFLHISPITIDVHLSFHEVLRALKRGTESTMITL